MAAWSVAAPAKLNLGLRVLGRRPDGYHELDTVFHELELADELIAEPLSRDAIELTLDGHGGGLPVTADADNLVCRAARAYRERFGVTDGVRFVLRKRIPAGGGLGGGSSDAAAALRLMACLWPRPTAAARAPELAARLGADVPFFLYGGTCRGRGIGERLQPIVDPPRWQFLLVVPPFGTATPRVFGALRARLIASADAPSIDPAARPDPANMGTEPLEHPEQNDLEEPAIAIYPELGAVRAALREVGVVDARLSGSGSTFFVARAAAAECDALIDPVRAALAAAGLGTVRLIRTASRLRRDEPRIVGRQGPDADT